MTPRFSRRSERLCAGSATRASGSLLLPVLATSGIGLLGSNTMPLFVGALLAGLSLDQAEVGLLASLELAGVAAGSLSVAPLATRASRRRLALAGIALAAVGFAGAALSPSLVWFGLARLVAGLGCGVVLAAGYAAASADPDPDRLFARVAFFGGAIAAVILFGLPRVIVAWGFRGGYWTLVALCGVAVPFLMRLPATSQAATRAAGRWPHLAAGAAALASITLFGVADQALWTFTERIGVSAGLTLEGVGTVLGVGTVTGLLGAVIAARLGVSRGRSLPVLLGLLGILAVRVGLAAAETPLAYASLQISWAIAFLFVTPYLLGTAAALDPAGRWAAAASAAVMAGTALGPAPAGLLMDRSGAPGLAGLLLFTSAASFAALAPVALWLDWRGRG